MAEFEVKKKPIDDACDNNSDKRMLATGTTNKGESLEDLLTTLSHQINNSDWLQVNTTEKFAAENPEVAKAFTDAAPKNSKDRNRDVTGDSV